jgi:hypothetical protein
MKVKPVDFMYLQLKDLHYFWYMENGKNCTRVLGNNSFKTLLKND